MPETRTETAPQGWQNRLKSYREQILDKALLGIPLGLVTAAVDWALKRLTNQPWQTVWILLPLVLLVFIAGRSVSRGALKMGRGYLLFLGLYALVFSAAASGTLLDWNRNLVLFEERAPRSWLAPAWFGDWRYSLVREQSPPPLVIVTFPPATGRSREEARFELVQLIAVSERAGALGVAFDFYLEGPSAVDPLLCNVVNKARIPVWFGYSFREVKGHVVRARLPASLQPCLPEERLGHLVAFADADGVARRVPLYFGPERGPSLSLRIARKLKEKDPQWSPPQQPLLRFTEPERDYRRTSFRELAEQSDHRELLRGHLVLAGEDSTRDSFRTPYGTKLGVLVHADAGYSLVSGASLKASPWWLNLAYTVAGCYVISSLAAGGAPGRILLLWAAGLSLGLGALAALLVFAAGWWFDIAYPLAAMWLLLPLLLAFRARARSA